MFQLTNLKERANETGIRWVLWLNVILEKCMVACVTFVYGSVDEPMVSLWEHGNELSSIKQRVAKRLSSWATVNFLKKDFALWNDLCEIMLIDTSHFLWISEKWVITFAPYMLGYLFIYAWNITYLILTIFQQDATYSVYYISVGSSTCFGCWHPSSGALQL